jgi:predicted DsbA family dithiol-disulfide isomerase
LLETLSKAFFMQGISLNDHEALMDLAATVGLDWAQVSMYLASTTDVRAVERLEQEVRNAGVDIVPLFIFNGKVTVAGAHEVKVLLEAMEMATTGETASVAE